MSASLIGRFGSSAFRLSTPCSVRCRSRALASLRNRRQGPSIMGSEDEAERSFRPPCRQVNTRSKRTCELTSSIVPRGTSFDRSVELVFPPIAADPAWGSGCYGFPGTAELGAVHPYAVQDHGQSACQRHDCFFHPTAPGDLHRPALEPGPFLRTQHALSCFVEHDPHHLVSAARYSAVPIDLAGLILGARQPKHGPDCLGFPE